MIYMSIFSELLKKEHRHQQFLIVVFILYLLMGHTTPAFIADFVDTPYGKVVVIAFFLVLFSCCHPLVGILGLLVAYELIRRSSVATGSDALKKYVPSEEDKKSKLTTMNQFPYTLEQEVVKKMAPPKGPAPESKASYSPTLDQLYDAAPIDYKGVI